MKVHVGVAVVVLLAFAAGATLGQSIVELHQELTELSVEIERNVQQKRAENSDAILATNNRVLAIMGNNTVALRDSVAFKREELELDRWLRENDTYPCFDEAFQLWDTYAYLTGWDVSWCATYAYDETNADSQYTFYSHAQTIVRLAARALSTATEAYSLSVTAEEQRDYVADELDYLRLLWGNYQTVLRNEIDGHEAVAEAVMSSLSDCFVDVFGDVQYWFDYLDTALDSCLAALA